ncbi:MAG: DUF4157 domain-containing protein, partial [Deltaproteobacteria bacterium]|nr:DUF4157 domain-containing protein [Deltaproteobacteria bacterium]
RGAAQPLPHLDLIQSSFGSHDVSGIRAHVGGGAAAANQQLGARAYAFGNHVAFASAPDLHTVAHEAAHVVQQRSGVALKAGIGQPGDEYEQHADQVADAVVRGESAAPLLDGLAGRGAGASPSTPSVQRKSDGDRSPRPPRSGFAMYLYVHEVALRGAVANHLADTNWPDPAVDVPFAPGGDRMFAASIAASIANRLGDGETIPQLLHPGDVVAKFHDLVPNLKRANWSPEFGRLLGQLVERAAVVSLKQRVGPRYRAALAQRVRVPAAGDLIAGHPIDPLVAQALTLPDVADTTQVAATEERALPKPAHVKARWLGRSHPELWNFVEVSPASASPEDVAATLWGDPKKSTMAFAIHKYGEVFRVAPAHARRLIAKRYRGEITGRSDTDESNATQILALARSSLGQGDSGARQFTQAPGKSPEAGKRASATTEAPTVQQIMGVEREIGRVLDTIRVQVTPIGAASDLSDLRVAYDARAARVSLLADADAKTRTEWLPVLQFQHTQLMTLAPQITSVVQQLRPIKYMPPLTLDAAKRQQRDLLARTLTLLVQAAGVSHLRDQSTAILRGLTDTERNARHDRLDAAQIDLDAGTREGIQTPTGAPRGTAEAEDKIARQRQAALTGRPEGRSRYEQEKAITVAGTSALRSRMLAAEHAMTQLRSVAIEVYGSPEGLQKFLPNVKTLPMVLLDVKDRLADVERTWDAAERDGTPLIQDDPNAPDDWAEWQGRAAGLTAARAAFAKIAGDQSLIDFLNAAKEKIRHRQMVNAVVSFAMTLLIALGTGMGAAALGARAAAALATEASSLAARALALAVDVGINVSINTVVQLAQADGKGSLGWTMLENTLQELFTRGMMKPLQRAEHAARAQAVELARLPHLAPAERKALLSLNLGARTVVVEMVGNMATQWAAHRLVETGRVMMGGNDPKQVTEPFALTVLQQGAALGLGKYFHGRVAAWKQYRSALEQTRRGQLPEATALFNAREQFYAEAKALADSLSPDPAAMDRLLAHNETLLAQERALFAPHGNEAGPDAPHGSPDHAPRSQLARGTSPEPASQPGGDRAGATTAGAANEPPAPSGEIAHRGLMLAASVGDTKYEGGGIFRVGTAHGSVLVEVRRSNGSEPRLRRPNEHAILEIPRGLTETALERAVVGKLTELQGQELRRAQGHKATAESALGDHGTGDRLSP